VTDAIAIDGLGRRFGDVVALHDVSLHVGAGEVHALLGPNGAGKTTLLRTLTGHHTPTSGSVRVCGRDSSRAPREVRRLVGLVPSGDRTFYLRLSGLENLVFFGRLHGLRRKQARSVGREALASVGLVDAADTMVGLYSHGMQKRLGIARALLVHPQVLLVDEATHDLDPAGARQVRDLVRAVADEGAAVLWATQRLDEIRGFAGHVTVLDRGNVRFGGTVAALMEHARDRRYLLRVRHATPEQLRAALGPAAHAEPVAEGGEHYLLVLAEDATLGVAIAALESAGVEVLTCRHEESDVEQAFLAVVGGAAA